jgi:hypothetical protein
MITGVARIASNMSAIDIPPEIVCFKTYTLQRKSHFRLNCVTPIFIIELYNIIQVLSSNCTIFLRVILIEWAAKLNAKSGAGIAPLNYFVGQLLTQM